MAREAVKARERKSGKEGEKSRLGHLPWCCGYGLWIMCHWFELA